MVEVLSCAALEKHMVPPAEHGRAILWVPPLRTLVLKVIKRMRIF